MAADGRSAGCVASWLPEVTRKGPLRAPGSQGQTVLPSPPRAGEVPLLATRGSTGASATVTMSVGPTGNYPQGLCVRLCVGTWEWPYPSVDVPPPPTWLAVPSLPVLRTQAGSCGGRCLGDPGVTWSFMVGGLEPPLKLCETPTRHTPHLDTRSRTHGEGVPEPAVCAQLSPRTWGASCRKWAPPPLLLCACAGWSWDRNWRGGDRSGVGGRE